MAIFVKPCQTEIKKKHWGYSICDIGGGVEKKYMGGSAKKFKYVGGSTNFFIPTPMDVKIIME